MPTRTLSLVSPEMRGPDVLDAQKLLRQSKWGSFYKGNLDSVYGPATAAAARDAKWELGYMASNVNNSYGDDLAKFLKGEAELTTAQKARRRARVKELSEEPVKVRGARQALKHLGVKEDPAGSNRVIFTKVYGIVGPWCAMMVSVSASWAGSKWAKGVNQGYKGRWHYCPTIEYEARHGINGLRLSRDPKTGDWPLFDWAGDGVPDHVGIYLGEEWFKKNYPDEHKAAVQRWGALRSGEYWTVEGNTSPDNDSNGGEQMIRKRRRSDTRLFAALIG